MEKGGCPTVFHCLSIGIAARIGGLGLNNWVSAYRNAKRWRENAPAHQLIGMLHVRSLNQPAGPVEDGF